jgi:hypothetical protein
MWIMGIIKSKTRLDTIISYTTLIYYCSSQYRQIIHFNFAVRTPPIFKGTYPYQSAQLVLSNLIIRSLIVHQRSHLKGLLEFYQY